MSEYEKGHAANCYENAHPSPFTLTTPIRVAAHLRRATGFTDTDVATAAQAALRGLVQEGCSIALRKLPPKLPPDYP
jgi:hypothetical protein